MNLEKEFLEEFFLHYVMEIFYFHQKKENGNIGQKQIGQLQLLYHMVVEF